MSIPKQIIIRCLQGSASVEEARILNKWLHEDGENRKLYYEMQEIWDSGHRPPLDNIVWKRLCRRIRKDESPWRKVLHMPEFRYGWYAAAASIAALVVLTTTLWLGQISDTAGKEIHYITCLTQQAERLQVILPDSSIVWLNANSELSYPEEFTEGREVTLTGEAFFDVRKSTEHQFTVKTKQMQVQVMGTQFMVSDYPDAKTVETVLLSGRVNVRPVDNAGEGVALTPNLQWQLSLDNMQACVNSVDAALYTGWITGKMAFENATLKEVSERLGRWYGIKISVSNDMDAVYRLTFTIRDETWKETQTVIRNIAPELTFAESGDNTEIIHMDKSLTR